MAFDALPKSLSSHITALEHIGYVVEDLKTAVDDCLRTYGLDDSCVRVTPPFGEEATMSRFAFINIAPGVEFELIEPCSDYFKEMLTAAPSGAGGINHMAYRVADLDRTYADIQSHGLRAGHVTPDGVVNTGSSKILYLDPADTGGVLIELIERS